jgi:pimeloyl-ACP methyl ester carboxylesterase
MLPEYTRQVNLDGFTYACRIIENSAPRTEPIVLLGGIFQNMHSFRQHEKFWTAVNTVVAVELPGLGTATELPSSYGFDFLTDALAHMLSEVGLPRINLVGVCYGYPAAYGYAQKYPAGVARLALVGAMPQFTTESRQILQDMVYYLEAGRMEDFARRTAEMLVCRDPDRTVRNRSMATEFLECVLTAVKPADIGRFASCIRRFLLHPLTYPGGIVGVPALCVTGEHDPVCAPDMGRQVAASIDGAWFTTMQETDHAMYLERGEEVVDLLVRFFTDEPLDDLNYLNPIERVVEFQTPQLSAQSAS